MAVQIGWRIRVAKEQTKAARDTIDGLDGKDAEPILAALDHALDCLRKAERAAQELTQRLIAQGRLPDERGSQPDRRA
jgi:hypothetical protein